MPFGSFSVDTGCSGMAYRCPRCRTLFQTAADYRLHEASYDPDVAMVATMMLGSRVYTLSPHGNSFFHGNIHSSFMTGVVVDADPCHGRIIVDGIIGRFFVHGNVCYSKGFSLEHSKALNYHPNEVRISTLGELREIYTSAIDYMTGLTVGETLRLSDLASASEDPFSGCRTKPELVPIQFCENCGMMFEDEGEWRRHFHRCKGDVPIHNDQLMGFVGETECHDRVFGRIHNKAGASGTYSYEVCVHMSESSLRVDMMKDADLTSRRLMPRQNVADKAKDHIRTKALLFFDRFYGEVRP